MSGDGSFPGFLAWPGGRNSVPGNAILLGGAAMLLMAFLSDLPHIAYISSFSLLLYYSAMNLSGLKVLKGRIRFVTGLGLVMCLVLMTSLPGLSWIVGAAVLGTGVLYYFVWARVRRSR